MEIARVSKPLRLKPKLCDMFLYLCTLTNGPMFGFGGSFLYEHLCPLTNGTMFGFGGSFLHEHWLLK